MISNTDENSNEADPKSPYDRTRHLESQRLGLCIQQFICNKCFYGR
jgi:hypothetical protein